MTKAIFLDRDGTINVDEGITHRIEDLKFEKGAIEGLKLLQDKGYVLIILTNQSGIGNGFYSEEQYGDFMNHMHKKLREEGVEIRKDFFCPHKKTESCECRKPKTAMLEEATLEFGIDPRLSWVIGDKTTDIETGKRAGCRTILLKTGQGGRDLHYNVNPNYTALDLEDAANHIIKNDN